VPTCAKGETLSLFSVCSEVCSLTADQFLITKAATHVARSSSMEVPCYNYSNTYA